MKDWLHRHLEQIRLTLSQPDALLMLVMIGLLAGILAGGVIVLFRLVVEGTLAELLPGQYEENFEGLPGWLRLLLPIVGGLAIGLLFHWKANGQTLMGVGRVLERLTYHQGYIGFREFLLQFAGAAIALVSGHSVGREGPHAYLGAAAGSLLGQHLSLPNNSIRTLVGCGVAAAIAASFNTPLAGVIFALEVVMMEYTLVSFLPIMLAAVSGNAISILFLGAAPAFVVPALEMGSLQEMPAVMVLGLLTGTVAACFIHLSQAFSRYGKGHPFWCQTTAAGLVVGICALFVPEVMGIGYDTVNSALIGEYGLTALLLILCFKVLATSACGGLGVPAGMVGPSLFMGAIIGGIVGHLMELWFPEVSSSTTFYVLLGMGAMMGASLQAPLAGLTAMLELTHNPAVVMPGMLAIVVANLTASELFGKESIFITLLRSTGFDYRTSPVLQALRRIGVGSVLKKNFRCHDRMIRRTSAERLLREEPEWLIVEEDERPVALMHAVDLARHIQNAQAEEGGIDEIDLMAIPAWREQIAPISIQANLQQALEQLKEHAVESLYVESASTTGRYRIYGILTREQIESAYHY